MKYIKIIIIIIIIIIIVIVKYNTNRGIAPISRADKPTIEAFHLYPFLPCKISRIYSTTYSSGPILMTWTQHNTQCTVYVGLRI